MFENKTADSIREEMLNQVTVNVSKDEGTLIYDSLSPVANELGKTYIDFETVLNIPFIQSTYGEYLDKKTAEYGVFRKQGTKATGEVKISGNNGALIKAGFVVQTADLLKYKTIEDATIVDGSANIYVEAVDIGTNYNIPAYTITQVSVAQEGINSIISESNSMIGGTGIESDEELKERALIQIRKPATSGNIHDYEKWALEVPGVYSVRVFPTWDGPGTVKVCVIDSNGNSLSQNILDTVIAHIEEERPVGASVTVTTASVVYIKFFVTIKRNNTKSLEDIKSAITEDLMKYLRDITFKDDFIYKNRIISLILEEEGVVDVISLTMDNSTANLPISGEIIPALSEVLLNEQI